MATPQVAGAAALIRGKRPGIENDQGAADHQAHRERAPASATLSAGGS